MTTRTKPDPDAIAAVVAGDGIDIPKRIKQLLTSRLAIERELRKLRRQMGEDALYPRLACRRCEYEWRANTPESTPIRCPCCGSERWQVPYAEGEARGRGKLRRTVRKAAARIPVTLAPIPEASYAVGEPSLLDSVREFRANPLPPPPGLTWQQEEPRQVVDQMVAEIPPIAEQFAKEITEFVAEQEVAEDAT